MPELHEQSPRRRVLVVGSGLAGLAAAVTAHEHGADVTVLEAAGRIGGATWDSAGWIWRYRELERFRSEAPDGDAQIQSLIIERLDAEIDWLRQRGVPALAEGTGREFTRGVRVDCRRMIEQLAALLPADAVQLDTRLQHLAIDGDVLVVEGRAFDAVVLAGGGYASDVRRIARERGIDRQRAHETWMVRPTVAGDGSTIDAALELGGSRPFADGRCLLRVVPESTERLAPDLLIAGSELLVEGARLFDESGTQVERAADDWSSARLLDRWLDRGGSGVLELPGGAREQRVHSGQIGTIIDALAAAGVAVESGRDGAVRMPVRAGITSTWCGLSIGSDGRVELDGDRRAALFAAGCDAAGTALGGSASGLAQALVLGRVCGQSAAAAP